MDNLDPEKNASCLSKQENIKNLFTDCATSQAKYQKLIDLGRTCLPLAPEFKTSDNVVNGCQSTMYLRAFLDDNGNAVFEAESEALISSGLAALLISVYSNEPPEVVLTCPPHFIEEIGIRASLTPGRSNGLSSMYLRMKQEALKLLVNR
ncbi:MAG TPA: SufE family protein [Rhabdochlamydiaceae bacterium]|nr:SufE family protein [Rhabdochlamydiaceae bacterium]